MGYKQRERKRRKRAAQARARAGAHKLGASRSRWWWLTPLRSTACCARCAVVIREGGDAVYRHEPREVRCVRCADRLDDSRGYRTSLRWEEAQRKDPRARARRRRNRPVEDAA
jgi:hypothetical protein